MKATKNTWQILRNNSTDCGLRGLYCSYNKIKAEKLKCIPLSIDCLDFYFDIDALDLITHSAARILEYLERIEPIFDNFNQNEINELTISCKFGIDGAQSGTNYAHHFMDESRDD